MKPKLEHIDLGKESSIIAFEYTRPNFDAPWHFHPQHELTYIMESKGTKFIGDYVGSYEPGELVLIRSNLPHCWKNLANMKFQSRSMVVQWNSDIFAKVPELNSVFKMLHIASKGIIFSGDDIKKIIPDVLKLTAFTGHNLYIQLLALLQNLSFCKYNTLSEASFVNDLPFEYSTRMAKVYDFIALNFHRKIYLKEIAGLVYMSEQSFSRFFSKMMGRPFFRFLNEYRINMAALKLIDTDFSVAQIGFACGFETLPFFYKQFRMIMHTTPSKYRKQFT
ncbi:HTH-type transcriptional activator RhaS [subsurface metagenome]